MATQTAARESAAPSAAGPTMTNLLRSEWVKFWSVRSSLWTLLATVAVTVAFSALFTWGTVFSWDDIPAEDRANIDPTSTSLGGLFFGQLAIAVLGVLVVSSEYSTGAIRTTFTAAPRRASVLLAKALVLAVVATVTGFITCFAAFAVGQAFLATEDIDASLGDPGVLRAVIGGSVYVAGSALFGFAIATVLRHTAGSITAAAALLLVVPPMLGLLPGEWGEAVQKHFTSNAGQAVTVVRDPTDAFLAPWYGYGVFTVEWLVVLVIGIVLIQRRDA